MAKMKAKIIAERQAERDAIRAEAFEEAAKWLEANPMLVPVAGMMPLAVQMTEQAAGVRALKPKLS